MYIAKTLAAPANQYAHRIVTGGVGHKLLQELLQAFAEASIDVANV